MSHNGDGRGNGQAGGNGSPSGDYPSAARGEGVRPVVGYRHGHPRREVDGSYTPVDFGFAVAAAMVGVILAVWVVAIMQMSVRPSSRTPLVVALTAAAVWVPLALIAGWPAVAGLLCPHPRRRLAGVGLFLTLLPLAIPGLWLLYCLLSGLQA